jgi:hypothetical protein
VAKADAQGLAQLFKVRQQIQEVGLNPDPSPIVMYFLTRKLGDKDISAMQKQIPNKGFVERWRNLEDDAKDFAKKLTGKDLALPSQTWKFLMQAPPEPMLFCAITSRPAAVEQKLKNFLTKWPPTRQKLPFPEMAEMRITPEHPEYKKILEEAFLLLLDGKLRSHSEIVKFLEPYSPPEPPPPPPPQRRGRGAKKEAAAVKPEAAPAGEQSPKRRGRKPKAASAEVTPATSAPVPAPQPVAKPQAAPPEQKPQAAKKAAPAGKPAPSAKPVPEKKAVAEKKPAPEKKAAPATKQTKAASAKPAKAAPAKPKAQPQKKPAAKKTKKTK